MLPNLLPSPANHAGLFLSLCFVKEMKKNSARQRVIIILTTVIVITPEDLDERITKAVSKAFEIYKINSTTQDELLTIKEVTKLLSRSSSWLQRRKDLRPVTTGKRNVRYSGYEVNEYLQKLRKK